MNKTTLDIVKHGLLIDSAGPPLLMHSRRLWNMALMAVKYTDEYDVTKPIVIDADAFERYCGIPMTADSDSSATARSDRYKILQRATKGLIDASVTMRDPVVDAQGNEQILTFQYFESVIYIKNKGIVKLFFAPTMLSFISQIKEHRTHFEYRFLLPLKTHYGYMLYQHLKSSTYGESGKVGGGKPKTLDFPVPRFREIMGLGDKYPRIDSLINRVMRPAIKDICEHTDFGLSFESVYEHGKTALFVMTYWDEAPSIKLKFPNASKHEMPPDFSAVSNAINEATRQDEPVKKHASKVKIDPDAMKLEHKKLEDLAVHYQEIDDANEAAGINRADSHNNKMRAQEALKQFRATHFK